MNTPFEFEGWSGEFELGEGMHEFDEAEEEAEFGRRVPSRRLARPRMVRRAVRSARPQQWAGPRPPAFRTQRPSSFGQRRPSSFGGQQPPDFGAAQPPYSPRRRSYYPWGGWPADAQPPHG